jgi:hypothetical protein
VDWIIDYPCYACLVVVAREGGGYRLKWLSNEPSLQQRVDNISKEGDASTIYAHITALYGEVASIRREAEIKEAKDAKALVLEAEKVENRLQNLNHENARIQEAQAKSVSRELYDADKEETAKWRETINIAITTGIAHRGRLQSSVEQTAGDVKALGERISGIEKSVANQIIGELKAVYERIGNESATLAGRITILEASDLARKSAISGANTVGTVAKLIIGIVAGVFSLILAAAAVWALFVPK